MPWAISLLSSAAFAFAGKSQSAVWKSALPAKSAEVLAEKSAGSLMRMKNMSSRSSRPRVVEVPSLPMMQVSGPVPVVIWAVCGVEPA